MDLLITEIGDWAPKHGNTSDANPDPIKEAFAKNVKKKGESFVPIHTQHRFALPYKLTAEEGTYYEPDFSNPYSFTALAVKGESLDLERFYKEIETIAQRDYVMYEKLVKPYSESGSKEESRLMVRYRMVAFRGDEKKYEGTRQEALENLFYWHLAQKFENTTVYKDKKKKGIGKGIYGDNRLQEFYKLGRTIQEVLSNVQDKEWVILFGTYED